MHCLVAFCMLAFRFTLLPVWSWRERLIPTLVIYYLVPTRKGCQSSHEVACNICFNHQQNCCSLITAMQAPCGTKWSLSSIKPLHKSTALGQTQSNKHDASSSNNIEKKKCTQTVWLFICCKEGLAYHAHLLPALLLIQHNEMLTAHPTERTWQWINKQHQHTRH